MALRRVVQLRKCLFLRGDNRDVVPLGARRGFSTDTINQLKRAYRHLLQSNTTHALEQIDADPTLTSPDVRYLVEFIRSSDRGVILRRPARRTEELVAEE